MPSERIQRRIDSLLDQAEQAADQEDWETSTKRAREALALDPECEDARVLIRAAEGMLGSSPNVDLEGSATKGASPPPLPASFAAGRYRVEHFLGEGGRKRVYLARDTRLDRDVAVAVIKRSRDSEGCQMREFPIGPVP
jgi:hypothetical protein